MKTKQSSGHTVQISWLFLVSLLFLAAAACMPGSFPGSTVTPLPTNTPMPTPTSSRIPTYTPTTGPAATARPTQVPDKVIFSDTFADNSNDWELSDLTVIKDGVMEINTGNFELAAIKIPIASTPDNVMVQVDVIPNAPPGADPSSFFYGVGCRVNQTASDFYFLSVSPLAGRDGLFAATYFQFREAHLIDYQFSPITLPRAENGDGFTATFVCEENNLQVLARDIPVLEVRNSDFHEGVVFLGVYQMDGTAGSARFDNLTVSEVH